MNKRTGNHSFAFAKINERLLRLSGTCVDDILRAGIDSFLNKSLTSTQKMFESKAPEKLLFLFTWLQISGSETLRKISHEMYTKKLQPLYITATFEYICSSRSKPSRVCSTRPDICASVSLLPQVTEKIFDTNTFKLVNKVILHLKKTSTLGLLFPKLNLEYLCLSMYSDTSMTWFKIIEANWDLLFFWRTILANAVYYNILFKFSEE